MRKNHLFLAFLFLSCLACSKPEMVKVTQKSYTIPGATFFPEGIAYNPKTGIFYTGSTTNGDIVQVNVETGVASLFSAGAKLGRTFCTGLRLDSRDRLWVCGAGTGIIQVLDKEGNLLKAWDTKALFSSGFINDCIITGDYIYFTDSQVKKIYRTKANNPQLGDLEEWLTFTDAQIPYVAGTNANGIEATPDGKYLIIVISNSGKLFRINLTNKSIAEIQLNATVASGDGILLDDGTLYVSRNATGLIFPVTLNNSYSQGTVGTGFGENLLFNTTMAKAGKYLLVVNAQLNRRSGPIPPVLPFTVSRVEIP